MRRSFRYKKRKRFWPTGRMRLFTALAGLFLVAFGVIGLVGYGLDLLASRRTSEDLQAIYHAAAMETPAAQPPSAAPSLAPAPTVAAVRAVTPAPTQTPSVRLPAMAYPGNARRTVSSRFKALQKESKYIVGWLSVHKMLDEAVVQRDNVFYLNHDARGNENVNGALFLDSGIALATRPYAYIIYGHNMKSGAMFGSLRNYENSSFYHSDPFITFDTQYEDGRYVVFAVGSVSTEESDANYLDFFALRSTDIRERQTAINALLAASAHTSTVDVQPQDQLLLLVTCVEKDEERRVVAARRIRDDETEETLKKLVAKSRKK